MVRASLSEVVDYDCNGANVLLECRLTFDHDAADKKHQLSQRTVPVSLEFFNPSTFRFELAFDKLGVSKDTGIELSQSEIEAPVEPVVKERNGILSIKTDALTIEIGIEEWEFAVYDTTGKSLLTEQHTDVTAKQERRSEPLGFSVEETNRWPFRIADVGGAFTLHADEHIYGFGEKFTDLDKRGQRIESWVTQPNGAETEDSYKNVPFFLSTRGYGLLVDTYQRTTFDIGYTSSVSHEITVDDDCFSFVLFVGSSFADVIESYTGLTGRPSSVPKWSLGVWMSRLAYQNREELENVAEEARNREFPVDVLHLDPPWLRDGHLCDLEWDREAFYDPEGLISDLHENGFKLCLWEYPYLLSQTDAFDEAVEKGYLVRDSRGGPYMLQRLSWAADRGGIIDFTNPEARQWWKEKHQPLVEMGVDAFKTDFGEYLPTDAVTFEGRSGRAGRNKQAQLYTKTVYEAMEEAGGDPLLWARPAWAGSQQYPVHWGGDPNTTFESMAASLRGGLSLGLSGFGFWSCDIGGFHGEPSPELFVRWAQFGLLGNSHARFHGTTPREPWEYGEEVARIVKRYARERYRLLPYIHRLAEQAVETGMPVLRPLILEFENDMAVTDIQTQLMLGDALMVAPVVESAETRTVYLPKGEWIDYWSDERYEGSQTITVDAPLDTMPVFQRGGTALPTREPTQYVDEMPAERVTLRAVLEKGEITYSQTIYETDDDGVDVSIISSPAKASSMTSVEDQGTGASEVAIDVVIDGDASRFGLELRAAETAPEEISLNDQALERVETDPDAGQWTYDAEDEIVIALF